MSPGIGVTASAVRITPWMIHGWRPTSVTIQPASMAMKPSGRGAARCREQEAAMLGEVAARARRARAAQAVAAPS